MKATVYWIAGAWPGRLGIVPRPRGGDWLDEEVGTWRAAGIDVVVSALTPEEIREFSLDREQQECRAQGIEFLPLPIEDRQVPADLPATKKLIDALEARLNAGKNAVIHCRQGIGRSSLLAASVFIARGIPAEEALQSIGKARGCTVPETPEQREWIKRFEHDLLTASRK